MPMNAAYTTAPATAPATPNAMDRTKVAESKEAICAGSMYSAWVKPDGLKDMVEGAYQRDLSSFGTYCGLYHSDDLPFLNR